MIRVRCRHFKHWLIIYGLGIVMLSLPAAQGKDPDKAQAQAESKALQDRSQSDMTLIGQLAQKPQLMNIDYLECYLGPKNASRAAASSQKQLGFQPATITSWTDASGRFEAYKLETSLHSRDDYSAEFNVAISDKMHVRLKQMDKILNKSAKPSFDEYGKPVQVYESRPDTKVMVYQAPGLVDVNQIKVRYAGDMLDPPSADDMKEASQHRFDMAVAHQKLGHHGQAAALLKAHLQNNPSDAEAHLKLAESYKAQCRINDSINEYRIALARSGDDDDLRNRCIQGLHSLKVEVPKEDAEINNSGVHPEMGANTASKIGGSGQNIAPGFSPIPGQNSGVGLNPGPGMNSAPPVKSPERININDVGF